MMRLLKSFSVIALASASSFLVLAEEWVAVYPSRIEQQTEKRIIGLNVDFALDHAKTAKAGPGLPFALKEMNIKSLRYPGGNASDWVLWAPPPYNRPEPVLLRSTEHDWPNKPLTGQDGRSFKIPPMNFDAFMDLAQRTGAEPVVVVALEPLYAPASSDGLSPTRKQLLDTAVAWVRYANITKGYNVKYWELGNENYLEPYTTAERYAQDVAAFSKAMKTVDPSIKIGANGPSADEVGLGDQQESRATPWWQTVLQEAGQHIDFMAMHSYPCNEWMSYEYYRNNVPYLTWEADTALDALNRWARSSDAARIRVWVTEMNSADWYGFPENKGWAHSNNTGHALVLADMVGSLLVHDKVEGAQVRATRSIKNESDPELWDTLDKNNQPLPTGQVLSIWGRFLRDQMVHTENSEMIKSYATFSPTTRELTVFLINKNIFSEETVLHFDNYSASFPAERWVFRGMTPEDTRPIWSQAGSVSLQDQQARLPARQARVALEPLSFSVIQFKP